MHCARSYRSVLWKACCFSLLSSMASAWKLPLFSLRATSSSFTSSAIFSSTPTTTPFLQNLYPSHTENINNNSNMLIRIRSNLGTWRLDVQGSNKDKDDASSLTMSAIENNDAFAKYRFVRSLSLDQAGKQPLDSTLSLETQSIQYGTMLYCRLEEKTADEIAGQASKLGGGVHGSSSSSAARKTQNFTDLAEIFASDPDAAYTEKTPVKKKKKITPPRTEDVIDLLDSDNDDSVELVAEKAAGSDQRSTKQSRGNGSSSTQPRKRQRSSGGSDKKKTSNNKRSSSSSSGTSSGRSTSSRTQENDAISKFLVASYNVWFGPRRGMTPAGLVYPKERMTAIVECLQEACMARPDGPLLFVGLQELTPSLVDYIKPPLRRMGYKLCTQPLGLEGGSYGVGIAVPRDMNIVHHEFVPYGNSVQGRGLLYIKTPTLLLATTHLESWMGDEMDGAPQREEQMKLAAKFCNDQLDDPSSTLKFAAIMGDLNWDDERKKKTAQGPNRDLLSLLPKGWKDAGKKFDYTYDTKENPMFGSTGLRRRFDRCIYYSKDDSIACDNLEKIGKGALPGLSWGKLNTFTGATKQMPVAPSDHFGIVMSFIDMN